jgi:hypothetical protein
MQIIGAPRLGWHRCGSERVPVTARDGRSVGGLLYHAVQLCSLQVLVVLVVFDLPLTRSIHTGGQPAVSLVKAGLLIVWLQLNVSGFRPVLACGWHGDAPRCELAALLGVWPSSRLAQCATGRDRWRLYGDVAVLPCRAVRRILLRQLAGLDLLGGLPGAAAPAVRRDSGGERIGESSDLPEAEL